jgi:hypothetical protein
MCKEFDIALALLVLIGAFNAACSKSEPVYLANSIIFDHTPYSLGLCYLKTNIMSTVKADLLRDYSLNMSALRDESENPSRTRRFLSECSKKCCDPNSSFILL